MATVLNAESLEKKLASVANTQDGIQTLSLWMIHHKMHYKKIVDIWFKALKQAKMSHRLTLFNLANDVIQNSRRKGFTKYTDAFGEILVSATPFVRDDKIISSINRIYKIWEERSIYSSEAIEELNNILGNKVSTDKVIANFKLEELVDQIQQSYKLNLDVKTKRQILDNMKVDSTSLETMSALKDRKMGQQFSADFDESVNCLEEYVKLLNDSLVQKKRLIESLEEALVYYDSQRSEAKIVANAYKNFGVRIKNLRKKLKEKAKELPSPVASPNPNAPSPSPSESEDLFGDSSMKAVDHVDATKGGDSPPSPEGTPEELRFSPGRFNSKFGSKIAAAAAAVAANQSPAISFMNNTPPQTAPVSKASNAPIASGSLDSRLTNLMENMQKLPQGVLNTLFGQNVPSPPPEENKNDSPAVSGTPLNDESTGRETPLQDETTNELSSGANGPITANQNSQADQGLSNLVNNCPPNWPQPPWAGPDGLNPFMDKDERQKPPVPSIEEPVPQPSCGADIMPMDMDLDDDEMEDAPGAIIEPSNNLITVIRPNSNSNNAASSDIPPTIASPKHDVHSVNEQSDGGHSNELEELENDNKLFQDTQRLIEQQLSDTDHRIKYPVQNQQNNFRGQRPMPPAGNSYYNRGPAPPRGNYRMYNNRGNDWQNNLNRPPRRPMYGNRPASPYRMAPPPRWRY